jgi:hypothetical protein
VPGALDSAFKRVYNNLILKRSIKPGVLLFAPAGRAIASFAGGKNAPSPAAGEKGAGLDRCGERQVFVWIRF